MIRIPFSGVSRAAAVALWVVGAGGQLVAQEGGIEGHVLLSPQLSARRPRFRLYAEYGQQVQPPAAPADTNEMANVVIYLDSVPPGAGAGALPPAGRAIHQFNETFAPHVLAVPVGSTVQFPNDDPLFHNVFSLSRVKSFDLGRYPKGTSKSVRFDRPGVVQVFCHIHSDMGAVIVVLASPLFVVPNARGTFTLPGIPAGRYRVIAWHERAKPIVKTVQIEPGRTTRLDFNIPIADVGQRSR